MNTSLPEKSATATDYWHGLAALRAIAMLLGVVLHSVAPFMSAPLRGLTWVYTQPSGVAFDIVFWWIHVWRIPLFFFLAGFFAQMTLQRYGWRGFVDRRIRRLLIPYAVAILTIGPIVYIVFHYSWYMTGQCTLDHFWPHVPMPEHFTASRFGPAHLWFLLELIEISFIYVALFAMLVPGTTTFGDVDRLRISWRFPLYLGLFSAFLLCGDSSPVLEWHNTFFHVPPRIFYHATYFIAGTICYRHRVTFLPLTQHYRRYLVAATPLSVAFLWLRLSPQADAVNPIVVQSLLPITAGILCWLLIFGLIGACNSLIRKPYEIVSYLSDASYWVYLIHLPIVAIIHMVVYAVDIASGAKCVITIITTLFISLSTYSAFVRHSVIGQYLHGPRTRSLKSPPVKVSEACTSERVS